MPWFFFKKKQPIPPVWTYDDSVSESPIKNFVAGVKNHLLADYPDGMFEYAQSFVEFRVYRHGVLQLMRFQVKFYAKNSIVLNQFGLWISPDVLQIEGYDLSNLEDRYYRLMFDSAEVMEMCGLQDFKYRKFETNYPEDFAPLFNQLGFFWVNGCVPLIERFNNLEAILTHCEEMLRTKKSQGIGSFSDLGYLHCQCLMILKRDWQSTHLRYKDILDTKDFEHLAKRVEKLRQRYN